MQEDLLAVMQNGVKQIGQDIIKQLVYKFRTLPPSRRMSAVNTITIAGTKTYRDAIWDVLLDYSGQATKQAAKEVKINLDDVKMTEMTALEVQLAEAYSGSEFRVARKPTSLTSIQFAKKPPIRFESLPKKTKDRIDYESLLLQGAQVKDLEKLLYFSYSQNASKIDSAKQLEFDLNEQLDSYIEGPSMFAAAANSSSRTINDARQAFFFDDEVLDKIESFTSINADPVAEICIELAGVTVGVDDPALVEYATPRHHNCKSTWVPNLKGDDQNPDIDGVGSLSKKAQDSQTF